MEKVLLTIVMLGALQGLLLFFALGRITNNRPSNRLLGIFVLLLSLTMAGRVIASSGLVEQFPNFLLLPDAVIFLYGPILYLYFRKLLTEEAPISRETLWHFLPALLYVLSELPMLLDSQQPMHVFLKENRFLHGALVEGAALLHNIMYLVLDYRLIVRYQQLSNRYFSYQQHAPYLRTVLGLIAICLLAWSYSFLARIIGTYNIVTALGYFIVWLVLPFIVYALGYFAMRQPELFRMPAWFREEKPSTAENDQMVVDAKVRLEQVMDLDKPYLNPRLSLFELAKILPVTPHVLSRVINQGYGVNFSTFVNTYRVREFQRLAQLEECRDYTVLAMALEAGFNSKTTFNAAFKDITQKTPKEFLQDLAATKAA